MSIDNITIKLSWEFLGGLADVRQTPFGGVYLFVFENKIVYVGKANFIGKRVKNHFNAMSKGLRTVWKPNLNENIYDLMCLNENDNIYEKYSELLKNKKVWIPEYWKVNDFKNSGINVDFKKDWQDYTSEYINKLKIYATKVEGLTMTKVESMIQHKLIDYFQMTYYKQQKNFNWLGKIENKKETLVGYKLAIEEFPILDDEVNEALDADLM